MAVEKRPISLAELVGSQWAILPAVGRNETAVASFQSQVEAEAKAIGIPHVNPEVVRDFLNHQPGKSCRDPKCRQTLAEKLHAARLLVFTVPDEAEAEVKATVISAVGYANDTYAARPNGAGDDARRRAIRSVLSQADAEAAAEDAQRGNSSAEKAAGGAQEQAAEAAGEKAATSGECWTSGAPAPSERVRSMARAAAQAAETAKGEAYRGLSAAGRALLHAARLDVDAFYGAAPGDTEAQKAVKRAMEAEEQIVKAQQYDGEAVEKASVPLKEMINAKGKVQEVSEVRKTVFKRLQDSSTDLDKARMAAEPDFFTATQLLAAYWESLRYQGLLEYYDKKPPSALKEKVNMAFTRYQRLLADKTSAAKRLADAKRDAARAAQYLELAQTAANARKHAEDALEAAGKAADQQSNAIKAAKDAQGSATAVAQQLGKKRDCARDVAVRAALLTGGITLASSVSFFTLEQLTWKYVGDKFYANGELPRHGEVNDIATLTRQAEVGRYGWTISLLVGASALAATGGYYLLSPHPPAGEERSAEPPVKVGLVLVPGSAQLVLRFP